MALPAATQRIDAERAEVQDRLRARQSLTPTVLAQLIQACEQTGIGRACKAAGISPYSFMHALEAKGLADLYGQARALRASELVEATLEQSDKLRQDVLEMDPKIATAAVSATRIAVDAKHWAATRMGRDDWSERYQTTQLALGIKSADGSEIVVRWGAPEGK